MDSLGLLMKKLRKDDLQNNVDALVFAVMYKIMHTYLSA